MKLNAYLPPKVLTDFLFNYDIDDVAYENNDDLIAEVILETGYGFNEYLTRMCGN